MPHRIEIWILCVPACINGIAGVARTDEPPLSTVIAPLFQPPAEYAHNLGSLRSPFLFDNGSLVRTADDWRRRREEILKYWHEVMGPWPELIAQPRMETLAEEQRGDVTQRHLRLEIAPERFTEDAYLLTPRGDNAFLDELRQLAPVFAWFGLLNSLSMALVKLTAPGVPDIYQGQEMLDYSLVDPDNRRPVDFARRQRLAEELEPIVERPDPELLAGWLATRDERLKLYAMMRLLRFRRAVPDVFAGEYRGLGADAVPAAVLGYLREHPGGTLLVLLPRFPALEDTEQAAARQVTLPDTLAGKPGTDVLTGLPEVMGTTVEPSDRPLPWRVVWLPRAG